VGQTRQVNVLLWPLFARSAWAQQATVLAGTKNEGAALAFFHSIGVGSASLWSGGHDRLGRCSGFYARSEWAQPATVVAATTVEGATLASVRLVGVSSASHCCGGHDS
jgi:hypothetical protein